MNISESLNRLVAGQSLTRDEARATITFLMSGEATPAQIGGLLVAMRMKGETVDEVTGAVEAMRELSTKVEVDVPHLVDTCGTGGTGKKLFNISSASAIVTAAAGANVAKHGNRGMSSSFGAADLLEAAGVNLALSAQQVARCVTEVGVGFMFAVNHHAAMRHVGPVRRELGVRTMFNLIAPLTNPASAPNQVIGVFDRAWLRPLAEVLRVLGSRHCILVTSAEGLDEFSLAGTNYVAELKDGAVREYELVPEDVGLTRAPIEPMQAKNLEESLAQVNAALADEGAAADIVALNAGAAIYAAGVCSTHAQGIVMAQDAMASGLARERLTELARISSLMGEA